MHCSLAVTNNDDGVTLIEGNVIQFCLLFGNYCLYTDGIVFIDVEVIYVNLGKCCVRYGYGQLNFY